MCVGSRAGVSPPSGSALVAATGPASRNKHDDADDGGSTGAGGCVRRRAQWGRLGNEVIRAIVRLCFGYRCAVDHTGALNEHPEQHQHPSPLFTSFGAPLSITDTEPAHGGRVIIEVTATNGGSE